MRQSGAINNWVDKWAAPGPCPCAAYITSNRVKPRLRGAEANPMGVLSAADTDKEKTVNKK